MPFSRRPRIQVLVPGKTRAKDEIQGTYHELRCLQRDRSSRSKRQWSLMRQVRSREVKANLLCFLNGTGPEAESTSQMTKSGIGENGDRTIIRWKTDNRRTSNCTHAREFISKVFRGEKSDSSGFLLFLRPATLHG